MNASITSATDTGTAMSIVLVFSLIIFRVILHRFPASGDSGLDWIDIAPLNAEQTIQILDSIGGLAFLSEHGGFITLIMKYLFHLNNLHSLLESNISILDPTILANMLDRIKCLIINHELIFGLIGNLCEVSDHTNIPIEFDAIQLHSTIRNSGNDLIRLYRDIERVLGIENSALPIH